MKYKIRKSLLKMIFEAKSGHPGGSLSCVDILIALYFKVLKPNDRFILSKGHAAPALYAIFMEKGYILNIEGFRTLGGNLQGHPNKNMLPNIEMSSGSLGNGLSVACGMALGERLNKTSNKVYVLLGDGECDEGLVWESAMFASHHKLSNLIAIIDRNNLQIDGSTESVIGLEPFSDKWKAFGWNVIEIDGHNIDTNIFNINSDIPTVIIAHTIKGKGISYMEGNSDFHGKAPNEDEFEIAMKELS